MYHLGPINDWYLRLSWEPRLRSSCIRTSLVPVILIREMHLLNPIPTTQVCDGGGTDLMSLRPLTATFFATGRWNPRTDIVVALSKAMLAGEF